MDEGFGTDSRDRALLRRWVQWWDGPGREGYKGWLTPPLEATRIAFQCLACHGIDLEMEGEHCRACGRNSPSESPTPNTEGEN